MERFPVHEMEYQIGDQLTFHIYTWFFEDLKSSFRLIEWFRFSFLAHIGHPKKH